MSSIGTLSGATSALRASQIGLNTSAHNLSNVDTEGYVRQQVLMKDGMYSSVGNAAAASMNVGYGVDVQAIRQVRDQFLDLAYREESAREGFYSAQSKTIEEIEVILGEIDGESFGTVLSELWESMNELSKDPASLETRGNFIQNAVYFAKRSSLIMEQFSDYQDNQNLEIKQMVDKINDIGNSLYELNQKVVRAELSGIDANDFRDQRNVLLDELSGLVDISYNEDMYGNVTVKIENVEFLTKTRVNEIELVHENLSTLVKPVWPQLNKDVFDFNEEISTGENNDKGYLKGFILARGGGKVDYTDMMDTTTYEAGIKPSAILNAQAQFDKLVHGIVTMINDTLCPNVEVSPATVPPTYELDTSNAPYGLDGSQGIELFVRNTTSRYNPDPLTGVYVEEDTTTGMHLYSADNIHINPEILEDYDKLCISSNLNEDSDNRIVEAMLTKWNEQQLTIEPGLTDELNYIDYYQEYISVIGSTGASADTIVGNQEMLVLQIDNSRESLLGVSSDEELGNVIKFQQAYNAAAKVVNVIDEMMEQVVTSLGIVGR